MTLTSFSAFTSQVRGGGKACSHSYLHSQHCTRLPALQAVAAGCNCWRWPCPARSSQALADLTAPLLPGTHRWDRTIYTWLSASVQKNPPLHPRGILQGLVTAIKSFLQILAAYIPGIHSTLRSCSTGSAVESSSSPKGFRLSSQHPQWLTAICNSLFWPP